MNQYFPFTGWKAIFPFALFAAILILVTCEEESPEARDYPRLSGVQITNIGDDGATFSADLYSLGSADIKQHGFLWGSSKTLALEADERIYLGPLLNTGVFSAEIRTALVEGKEYFVRPFVKTSEKIIYGPVTSFKSLGSNGPVITGFQPDSAGWGDTLKIYGKNFSWVANDVFLNDKKLSVIKTCDTTISAYVESKVTTIINDLSVTTAGNRYVYLPKKFKLIAPAIKDFYPKQAYWGDTISISGNYLMNVSSGASNYIRFGSANCQVLLNLSSDSLLKIKVPHELNSVNSILSISINGFTMQGAAPLSLLPPYFHFSPMEGTWGTTVTLEGRFNNILARNTFFVGPNQASVLSTSDQKITLKVPVYVSSMQSFIKYNVTPFSITSTDQFSLLKPVIKSFSPTNGATGTLVSIKGKYFNTYSYSVKFGTQAANVTSINDSIIVARVPAGIAGNQNITVKAQSMEVISESSFYVSNPIITGFTPLTATFNDQIVITGENFSTSLGGTTISFGNYPAEIISASQNQVVVKVPLNIDSIPVPLKVTVSGNYSYSEDKFTLIPHNITSVSPAIISAGMDITITGSNFMPVVQNNFVFWDIYPLSVKSATTTQIIATIPDFLPVGSGRISVVMAKYKRYSSDVLTCNTSHWVKIQAPQFKTITSRGNISRVYSGTIGNYAFILSGTSTFRFDPVNNGFLKLNVDYPYQEPFPFYIYSNAVLNDTLYLVGYNQIKAFDPTTNQWRSYPGPENCAVTFGLNSRLWSGLQYEGYSSNWYKFSEGNPASGYAWVRKGDFPTLFSSSTTISSYFAIGDKGYIVFANSQVWQFDPATATWSRKSDFPGTKRYDAVSFVLNGLVYYGAGSNVIGGTLLSDIWTYNPANDTWLYSTSMPLPRRSATAFTVGGRAFIGFGVSYKDYTYIDMYDFYEFLP